MSELLKRIDVVSYLNNSNFKDRIMIVNFTCEKKNATEISIKSTLLSMWKFEDYFLTLR